MRTFARILSRAALCSILVPAVLPAQGTLRGVLFDSLRTGRPLADAEVVLLGESRKTTTDRNGRFSFADLAAGTYTVAHWAPWLDTVALPPLRSTIEIGGDSPTADVRLATPSSATYQRAVCGTALDDSQGILIGETRGSDGAPDAGIVVGARWTETAIGVGIFERRLIATMDTSNAGGMYALCGVPVDIEVALRAFGDAGVGSGELILAITERVQRRDLGVAPAGLLSVVRGRVLDEEGEPMTEATVAVTGDSGRLTYAGPDGRFVLDSVPRRSTQLVARALGYVPKLLDIEMFDAEVVVDDLRLERLPPMIAGVTVSGEAVSAARLQFETRRLRGTGTFITDAQLEGLPRVNTNAVSMLAPRTAVQRTRQGEMIMIRRGFGFCRPRFFADGYPYGQISAEEEANLMERAKRIEVYTANFAPPEFNDFDGCGAVVVWTR